MEIIRDKNLDNYSFRCQYLSTMLNRSTLILILSFLSPLSLNASFFTPPLSSRVQKAQTVIIGKVIEIRESPIVGGIDGDHYVLRCEKIQVIEILKGQLQTPVIWTYTRTNQEQQAKTAVGDTLAQCLDYEIGKNKADYNPFNTYKSSFKFPKEPIYHASIDILHGKDQKIKTIKWSCEVEKIYDPKKKIEFLMDGLCSDNEGIKWGGAGGLDYFVWRKEVNDIIPKLLDIVKNDSDKVRYSIAVRLLGANEVKEAVEPLISRFINKNENPEIRLISALGLGLISDERALAPLNQFKDSMRSMWKINEVNEIINSIKIIKAIRDSLQPLDDNARVNFLINHLRLIPGVLNSGDTNPEGAFLIREFLKEKQLAIDSLTKIPCNSFGIVEYAVIKLFGILGANKALPCITNVLLNRDDFILRMHAIIALGKIGDETAIPALNEAIKKYNYEIRTVAEESIALIKYKNQQTTN